MPEIRPASGVVYAFDTRSTSVGSRPTTKGGSHDRHPLTTSGLRVEVDPSTCSLLAETIAGFDSAAGWALQAGNVGAWWAARLPREGVEEIYGENPSAIQAGAFHPPQQARKLPDGAGIATGVSDGRF